jgi:aquaporin TIP
MNTKALIAEFIGTFTLVFIGVGAIASNAMTGQMLGLTGIALAYGLAMAVMVSATAAVSGGHLNPAVTFGALITKKIDLVNGLAYIIVQCLGSIAGAYVIKLAMPEQVLVAVSYGIPIITKGATITEALSTEIVLTFFLVFVVFGTVIDKRAPKVGGLFIGLTVTMGVMMGAAVSGAAMNPARFMGPAVAAGGFENTWLYWVGPLVGGGLAALVYRYALEEKES